MNYKKVLAGVLSAAIISIATPYAVNAEDIRPISAPIAVTDQLIDQFKLGSFTGTVKEINDYRGIAGSKFVLVENEEGAEANFIVSGDTYVFNNEEITVGSIITGYFDASKPMITIYPAQYGAEIIVLENNNFNVKVDIFDDNLVSNDKSIKLNISDETTVVYSDGKTYKGELAGEKLLVTYDTSTRSIPAQTTPIKVVVLEGEVELPDKVEIDTPQYDVSTMGIVVNNKMIKAPAPYENEQGAVMVPIRAIADGLGYEVSWDSESQSIIINKGVSFKVGVDSYNYMKMAPIKIGTAPELVEGTTYVPLSFFDKVMKLNNAYVFGSVIVVNDGAKIQ